MCGILSWSSRNNVEEWKIKTSAILNSSRGKQAFGYAIVKDAKIEIRKKSTAIKWNEKIPSGKAGIFHNRLATDGSLNGLNNHPHFTEKLILIHNGVISNRHKNMKTQCDSEAIGWMIEDNWNGNTLEEAIELTIPAIKGNWRIMVMEKKNPEKIYFACDRDNLTIGKSGNEIWVASEQKDLLFCTKLKRAKSYTVYTMKEGKLKARNTLKETCAKCKSEKEYGTRCSCEPQYETIFDYWNEYSSRINWWDTYEEEERNSKKNIIWVECKQCGRLLKRHKDIVHRQETYCEMCRTFVNFEVMK